MRATASLDNRRIVTVLGLSAIALAAAALPAKAQYVQYNDFSQRCRTMNGAAQVDSCINALRYEPGNAEMMRRLGDGLLATNRPGGAFDAYQDALAQRPDLYEARQGRDEALRRVNAMAGNPQIAAVVAPPQQVYVPVQQVVVPAANAQPVYANPFDGRWTGKIEPRGQSFAVNASIVGGNMRIFYEDSTDRVTLEGPVDNAGFFQGKGFLKDKNKSSGDGGEPLAISGRFVNDRFEGTGSAGSKATTLVLNRD